ncbi:uncharacterized protein LOC129744421 [Uranotaenia lowii]|uniref:uncharacterized protein LOC129744420 n=1 Tax=Uranotaenia lowii TaxID=190385 RepID=UPI00247A0532|nr:uncharacterized protein LOC129744420 [Uranotaenia lowii]XP_055592907.1 uncharacterized protein LOC129744421 [Uranotaenia lowii]
MPEKAAPSFGAFFYGLFSTSSCSSRTWSHTKHVTGRGPSHEGKADCFPTNETISIRTSRARTLAGSIPGRYHTSAEDGTQMHGNSLDWIQLHVSSTLPNVLVNRHRETLRVGTKPAGLLRRSLTSTSPAGSGSPVPDPVRFAKAVGAQNKNITARIRKSGARSC